MNQRIDTGVVCEHETESPCAPPVYGQADTPPDIYRQIVEASDDFLSFIDRNYIYRYVNRAYLAAFKKEFHEIVGHSVAELFGDDFFYHRQKELVDKCLAGDIVHFESILKTPGFGPRNYEIRFNPAYDKKGDVIGIVVDSRDITDRKQTEKFLRFSNFAIEHAVDCIYWLTEDGKLFYANNATSEMLGYSREELISMNVLDINPNYDRTAWERRWADVREENVLNYETTLRSRDGRIIPVEIRANFIEFEGTEYLCAIAREVTERKQTEAALIKSEEKYRSIVETTSEWIWEIDIEGRHTYSNLAVEDILGYKVDEIVGTDACTFMHEKERDEVKQILGSCIRGKTGWSELVLRWRHKDGSYRFLESNALPMFDRDGELTGFRGSDRDITERKMALDAIKSLQKKNQKILESIGEGIYGVDQEGKITFINPAAIKMFRYDSGDIIGKFPHDIIHPVKADGSIYKTYSECPIYAAYHDGITSRVENEIARRNDGTSFHMEYTSSPIWNEYGKPAGAVVVFRDISDHLNTAKALQQSERNLRFLYEENPCMYFTVNQNAIVSAVNSFGAKTLGYSIEELTGNSVMKVFPTENHEAVKSHLRTCLASPGKVFEWEIEKICSDSHRIWVKETAQAVNTPEGEQVVLIVCRDITENIRAEQALKNKAIQDEFIAELGKIVLFNSNIDEIFDLTVLGLSRTLKVNLVQVLELLPDDEKLLLRAGTGWEQDLIGHAKVSANINSYAGFTLLKQKPVVVMDIARETRFSIPPLITNHGIVSSISTIIEGRHNPFGVLGIHTTESRTFTNDEIHFVQTVANLLGEFIERQRAEQALRHTNRALQVLSLCNNALIHARDENALLHEVCRVITVTGGYRLAWIGYPEMNEQKSVRVMASSGKDSKYLKYLKVSWADCKLGRGPVGKTIRTGKLSLVNNVHTAPDFEPWRKLAQKYGVSSIAGLPLKIDGSTIGSLTIYGKEGTTFNERELQLLQDLAENLAYGISTLRTEAERKQTHNLLLKSRQRLRNLAERLQQVREEERISISREIHDELGQTLTGLRIDLSWMLEKVPDGNKALSERVRSSLLLADETLETVRRMSHELRPAMLDDLGLEAAIEWQVEEFSKRTGCNYNLDLNAGEIDIDNNRDTIVFRILQESLTNVTRHAEADHVKIGLYTRNNQLVLTVMDNGKGIKNAQLESNNSIGLIGMRERAGFLSGHVDIYTLDQGGTAVQLYVPLNTQPQILQS